MAGMLFAQVRRLEREIADLNAPGAQDGAVNLLPAAPGQPATEEGSLAAWEPDAVRAFIDLWCGRLSPEAYGQKKFIRAMRDLSYEYPSLGAEALWAQAKTCYPRLIWGFVTKVQEGNGTLNHPKANSQHLRT
jgi:hypothetical protein